jgi:hypothetical protein
LEASNNRIPRLGHLEQDVAVWQVNPLRQHTTLLGALSERKWPSGRVTRCTARGKLTLKLHANTACVAPDYATRTRQPIAVNNKIEGFGDRSAYLQLGTGVRQIVDDALGGVPVLPNRSATSQYLPSSSLSTIRILSAIVDLDRLRA